MKYKELTFINLISEFSLNWSESKNKVYWPTGFYSFGYSASAFQPKFFTPICFNESYSVISKIFISSFISIAFLLCSPATIVRRIMTIYIDAIKNMFACWFRTHVGDKVVERFEPGFANLYASAAVTFKAFSFIVIAASLHCSPSGIFRRICKTMAESIALAKVSNFLHFFGTCFFEQATARFCMVINKITQNYICIFATITQKLKDSFIVFIVANVFNNSQSVFLNSYNFFISVFFRHVGLLTLANILNNMLNLQNNF